MAEKKKPVKKTKVTKAYKPGKYCPKCGSGVRLAQHTARLSCGKCGYSETVSKG